MGLVMSHAYTVMNEAVYCRYSCTIVALLVHASIIYIYIYFLMFFKGYVRTTEPVLKYFKKIFMRYEQRGRGIATEC